MRKPLPDPTPERAALDEAVLKAGGLTKLGDALEITPQAVGQWRQAPAKRVLQIEKLTGVSRHQLRPDIYPADASAA